MLIRVSTHFILLVYFLSMMNILNDMQKFHKHCKNIKYSSNNNYNTIKKKALVKNMVMRCGN